MTALADARSHLAKAQEFLEAAEVEMSGGLLNAAACSAVLSGINAKDTICLRSTGQTRKSANHGDAVAELGRSGPAGKRLESTFRRLLTMKTASQYQAGSIGLADAHKAVEYATRMVEAAAEVLAT